METLRRGRTGWDVKLLQKLLNKALVRETTSRAVLDVDGSFGPHTEAAVQAFQERHRPLAVDG